VSDSGFVVSYIASGPRSNAVKVDTSDSPVIDILTTRGSNQKLKIDLEPYWEGDARKVVFRARVGGLLRCTFSPRRLVNDIAAFARDMFFESPIQVVSCQCGTRSTAFHLPDTQKWKTVEISQLLNYSSSSRFGVFGEENCLYPMKLEDGSSDLLYLHAAKDDLAQVLACVCFWRIPKFVAMDCLKCAWTRYAKWKNHYKLGVVLIDAINNLPPSSD
jgi:hypothetical protein